MAIVYDPATSRSWKAEIKRQMVAQYSGEMLSGPLHLYVNFYMPRPKSNKSKDHVVKPDVSNMLKAFEDAIENIVYHNDSQIIFIAASKEYCNEKHPEPCVVGTIGEWDGE